MPYLIASRKRSSALTPICRKLSGMFRSSAVVSRGRKSMEQVASNALMKGFSRIVVLSCSNGSEVRADVMCIRRSGNLNTCERVADFRLYVDGEKLRIGVDGDEEKEFIAAASE